MKKKALALSLSLVVAMSTLVACGSNAPAQNEGTAAVEENNEAAETTDDAAEATDAAEADGEVVDAHNWAAYDELIKEIKMTTDFEVREGLMHKAEDMLMETGAILPLYYYTDIYMQKSDITNIYSNLYGYKFFMFADTNKDTISINLGSEPDKLDPALNSSVDGACLAVNSFAGLYTFDSDLNVVPDLAKETTVSEDGLTYTITLLDDLKWSDGSELNANDFVYSWNRAVSPDTAADYAYMFDVIGSNEDGTLKVTASEDAKTLTIELLAPCAYFYELLAFPAYFPVKQAAVEAAADWQTNPGAWCQDAGFVTNGAYTCTEWKHDESMTYTKNPYYHRADEVKVETLKCMLSSDDTAILAAYNAGNVDFIDSVPTDEIKTLKENPEFYVVGQLGTYYVSFNVNSSLFEGKTAAEANAMRRAFALLVDRDYIVENIGQAEQIPANAFIPNGMGDGHGGSFKTNDAEYTYADEATAGYYNPSYSEENVAEAIALLESAGFKFEDGMLSAETPISFEYLTNDTSGHIAVAEALQQDFGAIGVDMTIKSVDWNVFLNERKAGNYDVARNGWIADFGDPINMLEMWTSYSGNNDCQFGK